MRLIVGFLMLGLASVAGAADFPLPLSSYQDSGMPLLQRLTHRVDVEPFNLVATIIFLLAITHTFFCGYFRALSKKWQEEHMARQKEIDENAVKTVSFGAQFMHFLGEVEAVFGIWAIVLAFAIYYFHGWGDVVKYIGEEVNFTEPMFIVVIMAIASTRPVLKFSEGGLQVIAALGGKSVAAWWLTILTFAPILGSFITEPAAMTIAALLMGKQFYIYQPKKSFKYASLGLLFVNISVGGTLTNFAAPPVLMVAGHWNWSSMFMFSHFGWKAIIGILICNLAFFIIFFKEFKILELQKIQGNKETREDAREDRMHPIPHWVTAIHILFLGWVVFIAHYPALFIGGFLFFIAFMSMTDHHQDNLHLHSPMLVGFFLAGLVIHGGLQGWWIEPLLGSMAETPLYIAATVLTAFNDNAAITYLSTLVPDFSAQMKYAVVAGAVTGGGLTVIANAPNPAGQAILSRYFPNHFISPFGLLLGALIPTLVMAACFLGLG